MLPGGPYPTDRASLEEACDIDSFRGSGPGGQNRNKRETGIRLTHRATGVVAMATERRSRLDNLEAAYARMAARLDELQAVRRPRRPTRPSRASIHRRLDEKRRQGERKAGRREVEGG